MFELRRRIAGDGGGGRRVGLVLEGMQLRGGQPGEAEGHAAGAVHARADRRRPCTLLRQRVAERTVGDEAVSPERARPNQRKTNQRLIIRQLVFVN